MAKEFKKRNLKFKGSKYNIYLKILGSFFIPDQLFRSRLKRLLDLSNDPDKDYIIDRVNYYNKINHGFNVSSSARSYTDFKPTNQAMYYYDIQSVLRYFPKNKRFDVLFGDITHVPELPTIVKSRPIENSDNSILLKLNSIRHFYFVSDDKHYEDKIDQVVWRGKGELNPMRMTMLKKYFDHPLFNIGSYPGKKSPQFRREFLSIRGQLAYKFILSIEGNDVATNLKWILNSNSLCFMPKSKYETWFMEGRLIPGVHYVEVKNDFSDLEEKVLYYKANPNAAKEIINNANAYAHQFVNPERELKIALLVLDKYLKFSEQNHDK